MDSHKRFGTATGTNIEGMKTYRDRNVKKKKKARDREGGERGEKREREKKVNLLWFLQAQAKHSTSLAHVGSCRNAVLRCIHRHPQLLGSNLHQ